MREPPQLKRLCSKRATCHVWEWGAHSSPLSTLSLSSWATERGDRGRSPRTESSPLHPTPSLYPDLTTHFPHVAFPQLLKMSLLLKFKHRLLSSFYNCCLFSPELSLCSWPPLVCYRTPGERGQGEDQRAGSPLGLGVETRTMDTGPDRWSLGTSHSSSPSCHRHQKGAATQSVGHTFLAPESGHLSQMQYLTRTQM